MRVNTMRGDTIIEVMLAFTVFAMLAVGAMSIMNQGVASAQEALETTLVREEIDGQAEALRFLHQAYMDDPTTSPAAKFKTIRQTHVASDTDPSEFGKNTCLSTIPNIGAPFVVNPKTLDIVSSLRTMSNSNAPAYAQLHYNDDGSFNHPYGMWIEAIEGSVVAGQPEFIDFHIRACWYSVTSEAPRTLGTIVRLYVPAV